MNFYTYIIIGLTAAIVGSLFRVIAGPTIWDRLLGLNVVSSKIVMAVIIFALMLDAGYLLDIAIIYAMLGYLGGVLTARFIERRGNL
jgi:multicomponent Na+:H+ antiporter subunit F